MFLRLCAKGVAKSLRQNVHTAHDTPHHDARSMLTPTALIAVDSRKGAPPNAGILRQGEIDTFPPVREKSEAVLDRMGRPSVLTSTDAGRRGANTRTCSLSTYSRVFRRRIRHASTVCHLRSVYPPTRPPEQFSCRRKREVRRRTCCRLRSKYTGFPVLTLHPCPDRF